MSSSLFAKHRYWIMLRSRGVFRSSFLRSPAGPTDARRGFSARAARPQRGMGSQRAVTSPAVICHTSPPQLSSEPVCLPL